MLYSVLICDLVFKLRDLRDIYSDSKAKKIIDEIEVLQTKKPTSSEWESKLIEEIKSRTNLFESSDIVAIESLQKYRHLSAHPVLSNSDLLFTPSRETVQSLMRSILEGILTHPPFFSNKIFDTMLTDLVEVQDSLVEDEALNKYVVSRYEKRLKNNDFHKVFRGLWKLVFRSTDELSTQNATLLYRVLCVLTSKRKSYCVDIVKNESNYYSNITKEDKISALIRYLAKFPQFYDQLDESLKLIVQRQTQDDGELQFISWFLKSSVDEHFIDLNPSIEGDIPSDSVKFMEAISLDNGAITVFCDYLIKYFSKSGGYAQSTSRLEKIRESLSAHLQLEQAKEFLNVSNENRQIYEVWDIKRRLKLVVEKFENDIDKSQYGNIYQQNE